jgi:branched-chain amino acid transport system ATP-binding protein
LELRNVQAGYRRYRALFDVSFTVAKGSVTAMLGPNGAGKSTVARVVAGLVPASSGSVSFAGQEIMGLSVARRARRGLAFAPEGRPVFSTLTVEDNLLLTFRRQLSRRDAAAALARTYDRFPHLQERRRQLAGTLSGGEQRLLALARVLAVPPELLMVDELSLGLAPKAVDEVFAALREINQAGTTILVVEQQIRRALDFASHVVVLRKGRVIYDLPASDMTEDLASELLPVSP